ncbi:helix-turn-helix transcriptional regulator [Bacteroidia bacterium]|nr:helix-turn-helix transcriptional regulator [Bacteroidia bacterium]
MKSQVFILADNQDISKAGIRYLLKEIGLSGKLYEALNKKELIQCLSENDDATIVLDYTNLDFNNIEDLLVVGSRFPRADWILFSDDLSLPFLKRIYIEKTFSILLKNSTLDEIKQALVLSQKQNRYICPRVMQFISVSKETKDAEKTPLTSSEQEILKLIAVGKSVKEIAEERFSSVHTIMTHKKNIFRKLEVNNVHEATKYALRSGLIDTMDYYI